MDILLVVFASIGLIWLLLVLQSFLSRKGSTSSSSTYGVDKTAHVDLGVDMGDVAGVQSIQGARAHMEDTYQVSLDMLGDGKVWMFGVFDGHGGHNAAQFAAKHLPLILKSDRDLVNDPGSALTKSFEKLDSKWLEYASRGAGMDDGSTAIVACIVDGVMYVANLGDSRCVLSCGGVVEDMSVDHKPNRDDERERVENLGGRIIHYGTWRVEGILAVTRAFGDRRLKKYVCATPEIKRRKLKEGDEYIVLASDGVWDVMSSQGVVDTARQNFNSINESTASLNVTAAAQRVTNVAWQKGSMDNITSMVVDVRRFINTAS